jgi:hypothetical protein
MNSSEILLDGFSRISGIVHRTLDGISPDVLTARLDPEANTIAWLVWHLSRVADDHLADAFDSDQVWTAQGWSDRFALPFEAGATGYAQTSDEVAAVRVSSELLAGYLDAVQARAEGHLGTVTDADLDRVVDTNWDPPVTLGVRLISVMSDGLQHAGQAAYVRGVAERRSA